MSNSFDVNWLNSYQNKRKEQGNSRPTAKTGTKRVKAADFAKQAAYSSPHAVALQYLASHPDDLKGKQEHYAQVRVFFHFECSNPYAYKRLHATPNGGLRDDRTAMRMKAEGQKRGYPDMSLDVARGVYLGMRIELKHGRNKPSDEQKEWLNMLTEDGYYCCVCYGEQQAIEAIEMYLALDDLAEMPPHVNDALWQVAA